MNKPKLKHRKKKARGEETMYDSDSQDYAAWWSHYIQWNRRQETGVTLDEVTPTLTVHEGPDFTIEVVDLDVDLMLRAKTRTKRRRRGIRRLLADHL